jgi:hypothetical protein
LAEIRGPTKLHVLSQVARTLENTRKAARTYVAAQKLVKTYTTAALMMAVVKRATLAAAQSAACAEQLTTKVAAMSVASVAQPRPTQSTQQGAGQQALRGG